MVILIYRYHQNSSERRIGDNKAQQYDNLLEYYRLNSDSHNNLPNVNSKMKKRKYHQTCKSRVVNYTKEYLNS